MRLGIFPVFLLHGHCNPLLLILPLLLVEKISTETLQQVNLAYTGSLSSLPILTFKFLRFLLFFKIVTLKKFILLFTDLQLKALILVHLIVKHDLLQILFSLAYNIRAKRGPDLFFFHLFPFNVSHPRMVLKFLNSVKSKPILRVILQ